MNTLTYLANLNKHPRDDRILFDEPTHVYTIDGDSGFTSVTTWNHSHFEHFDSDSIIDNMMKSKKWSQNKYYGMTREEIKASWDKNRDEAAEAGAAGTACGQPMGSLGAAAIGDYHRNQPRSSVCLRSVYATFA